ncbi:MAG: SMC-Scp complex subunit ScpB [Planctomycetaceae bacterium]|jgi:segregation and condensation protein B|nr:SMC-Scp complex subunit ScpB [Planctomycetaceae bacterium]
MRHPYNIRQSGDYWQPYRRHSVADIDFPPVAVPPEMVPSEAAPFYPLAALEAVLFLAKEPLPVRRLTQLANLPEGTKTKALLQELNEQYNREQSAFCITEAADGYQLRTRPEFAPYLVRMQGIPPAIRLTQQAMETLTVIAYKQPVSRTDIEQVRGVQCGEIIRQLLDQDLVKISGRSTELGRPFLYATTKKFLLVFGLKNLHDLPEVP